MLKMIAGAHIPSPERLTPSYMLSGGYLTANEMPMTSSP